MRNWTQFDNDEIAGIWHSYKRCEFDEYPLFGSAKIPDKYKYVLWEIISGKPYRSGIVSCKKEAQKWVDSGVARGQNRCWHEHSIEQDVSNDQPTE